MYRILVSLPEQYRLKTRRIFVSLDIFSTSFTTLGTKIVLPMYNTESIKKAGLPFLTGVQKQPEW